MKKTYKVIIDTDPGIDDTNALVYILNEPQFDVKLFSVVWGNVGLKNATRNMCHILDIFGKNIPVVQGHSKRFGKNTEDATFLHTIEGLGGYVPPKATKTQPIKMEAEDAMYEVLKQYPHEISILVLGPHTNVAYLLKKHPDAKDLIKEIIFMGGAPKGIKANPNHNSFNIRTDAPAFKITLDSKVKTVMIPSSIGRDDGYFTSEQVEQIKNTNDVGRFLARTFETYWEPNYTDHRIATNDLSAVYYLTNPHMYKTKRADIEVDVETGKTIATYHRKGALILIEKLNRKKFMKMVFKKLQEMDDIKIPQLDTPIVEEPKMKKTATKTSSKTKGQKKTKTNSTKQTSTTKTSAKPVSKKTKKEA